MSLALYLHIPFCRRKCRYCDFVSTPDSTPAERDAYVAQLLTEMAQRAEMLSLPLPADTLFFGGGTPSLLAPAQIERLIAEARARFALATDAEITLEANPGTIDAGWLAACRQAGVNRLSLGVQSFDGDKLRLLGRLHDSSAARETIAAARQAGFDNLGIDLMHGLPGQSLAGWRADLETAVSLGPEHISAYGLSVEEGTPFARDLAAGQLELPEEELAAALFSETISVLTAAGYEQYEISNFARPGQRSRHNQVYWQREPYLGLGAAAHSLLPLSPYGSRFANPEDIAAYAASLVTGTLPETTELSRSEAMAEFLFLGLRLRKGIDPARFAAAFGITLEDAYPDVLPRLVRDGLLLADGDRLALSDRGLLLANQVLLHFV